MELPAGTRILDRYEVEGPLGQGGMGRVYQVRDVVAGTLHALKVLPRVDDALRHRLLREGRLQGGLDHPGVVRVTDVLDVDGHPGLVLELVSGGRTLADRLREGRVDDAAIDALAEQLFAAVAAAHAHGLVHRDLKPANILLDGERPRIADFGLAKALGDHASLATVTGALLGTPSYMAPEQVQDPRSVDTRADLFSLGAVLYELLSGTRAFPGAPTEAMWRAARGDATPLDPADPRRAATMWALRPDPQDRPGDIQTLQEAWRGEREVPAAVALDTWHSSLTTGCPDPDELVDRQHAPDIAAHLAGCPRCRIDLRLYRDFTRQEAPRWPFGRWLLGFLLGSLGSLATMTALMGGLIRILDAGPFLLPLLFLPGLSGMRLAHAVGQARAGQESSVAGWFIGPVSIFVVGAVATAMGAEQALAAIAQSIADEAPPERLASLAAQATHIALSTWTIGYATGLVLVALPVIILVVLARDRASDPGFDQLPVVVGVGGAAGLWLAEGSASGLVAFGATTAVALFVGLLPTGASVPLSWRQTVAVGAAVLIAVAPVAARVEQLRRAVLSPTPQDAWVGMLDMWSLGWGLLAVVIAACALRPRPVEAVRGLGVGGAAALLALGALAAAPTWWTVVRIRALGEAMFSG